MGKVLDRLAKRLWIPWLACVSLGMASVALGATGYGVTASILIVAVVAAMLVVLLDYLIWFSRALDAVGGKELRGLLPAERDWPLLTMIFASMLTIGAVYVFDLTHDLIMPLVASVMVPLSLKQRSELAPIADSRQPAR